MKAIVLSISYEQKNQFFLLDLIFKKFCLCIKFNSRSKLNDPKRLKFLFRIFKSFCCFSFRIIRSNFKP